MPGPTHTLRVSLGLAMLLALAPGAGAGPVSTSATVLAQAQPQPQARPPARSGQPAARQPDRDAGSGGGDAHLRQRVEQLEEQLSEMQVVIGTLESLARTPSSAPASGMSMRRGPAGDDQGRIEDLETQVRALTNQIEQLSDQVRQLGGRRTDAGPTGTMAGREGALSGANDNLATRPDGSQWQWRGAPSQQQETPRGGSGGGAFGSLTVTPGPASRGGDAIGGLIAREPEPQPDRLASAAPDVGRAAGNPKELYETAYGYLLQQDYASAEASFEEFLRNYPNDRLAADAQYWLGEALYVQRRYKPAGQAFLKVIQNHQASAKVPNSILKLAMTLEQLGQKDCALFNELETRHPNAAADIKNRARVVRQRVGC